MGSDAADTPEADNQKPANNEVVTTVTTVVPTSGMRAWGQRMILKWLAGGVGHPYVKQIRDNLDEQEGRSRVNMMLAEEVGRQAIQDSDIVDQYKARILGDLWRKQVNIDAVGQKAGRILGDDPNTEQESQPGVEPDADVLGAISREAESASSEELRDRLARLLAGEIRHPGSIGRATIRLVADLDQETLSAFQDLMVRRIKNYIVKGSGWDEGNMFSQGMRLESAGLVHASNAFLSSQIKANRENNAFLMGDNFGLVMAVDGAFAQSKPVWLLTRAGSEIANLLPSAHDERVILREVFESFEKEQINSAYIGRIMPTDDGAMVMHDELLFTKSPA